MSGLGTFLRGTLGNTLGTATYEFDSNLHGDLLYQRMRVGTSWLDRCVRGSLAQHLAVPGGSDFRISAPDNRLDIPFCHEGDVHLKCCDADLMQALIDHGASRDIPFGWESA